MRSLLSVFFDAGRNLADGEGYRLALMSALWRKAVGETIAAKTEVTGWSGRSISVACAGARWKRQLESLRGEILDTFTYLGSRAPLQIRFTLLEEEMDTRQRRSRRRAAAARGRERTKRKPRAGGSSATRARRHRAG